MGPSELGGISRVPRRVGGTASGVGGRASLGWKRAGLQAMEVIAGGWLETTRILAERAFCPYARRPFLGAVSAGVPCPQSSDRSLPPLAPPTWVTGSGAGLTASPVGPPCVQDSRGPSRHHALLQAGWAGGHKATGGGTPGSPPQARLDCPHPGRLRLVPRAQHSHTAVWVGEG